MGRYDTAKVCMNGHLITNSIEQHPEHREPFCSSCGASTITKCPNCNSNIRGEHQTGVKAIVIPIGPATPPTYCVNCGKPFPWTEKKLKVQEAMEVLKGSGLSNTELAESESDLNEITKDSPDAQSAALRLKKHMLGLGSSAMASLRSLFVDIASETVKKTLGL